MPALFDKLLRIGEGKILRQLEAIVATGQRDRGRLRRDERRRAARPDRGVQGSGIEAGETLDELMPEAFATVREAAKRTLGQRHFDVQIMGGAALHLGNIAEMKTGEGKTLVATLPAYLNALTGKGVHVVTVNDYLARVPRGVDGPGLPLPRSDVGDDPAPDDARASAASAYNADITYGTNNEFGFDYLRDNMAGSLEDCVQRGHHYAIVDEVDSILIDEARTPLIISGPDRGRGQVVRRVRRAWSKRLRNDADYEFDEKKRTVSVLEPGIEKVEDHLGIDNLYDSVNTPLI